MKHINESIIGRKGNARDYRDFLESGDIVKTSGGHLLMFNGTKDTPNGAFFNSVHIIFIIYYDSLLNCVDENIAKPEDWDIAEIYKTSGRVKVKSMSESDLDFLKTVECDKIIKLIK